MNHDHCGRVPPVPLICLEISSRCHDVSKLQFQYTQLFHCQENNIQYYWDTTNNVYHYHSKLLPLVEGDTVNKPAEEEEEEEGELTDDQNTLVNY